MSSDIPVNQSITRPAPSPTGAMDLGNAPTFPINYLLARRGEATMDELLEKFTLSGIPPRPVVFTEADDRFLLER